MTNFHKQLDRALAKYSLGEKAFKIWDDESITTLMKDPRAVEAKSAILKAHTEAVVAARIEEVKIHRGKFYRWGHASFMVKTAVKYFDDRLAQLRQPAEGAKDAN